MNVKCVSVVMTSISVSRRPKPHSGTKRIEPLFPGCGTCPMVTNNSFYFTSAGKCVVGWRLTSKLSVTHKDKL